MQEFELGMTGPIRVTEACAVKEDGTSIDVLAMGGHCFVKLMAIA